MRSKNITHLILEVVLLLIALSGFPMDNLWANEDSKYLEAVREFADNVLKYGRDTYGPKHTPLFVDGLNVNTHEPVKWISPDDEKWILSNLASQQNLFRTLDGLTKITGDQKYRQAAMEAIEYTFTNLQTPNGLLHWGGHQAYDAQADRPCGRNIHELKTIYPHYELMWEVDPQATKQFIEAFWSAHILDWSNLDMDRHCYDMNATLEKPWDYEYKGGPAFFKSKRGGVGFLATGTSLIHSGTNLYRSSHQQRPLVWSKRLAKRFVDVRHPNTGISYEVYNFRWPQLGSDLNAHFDDPRTTYFPFVVFELNASYFFSEITIAYNWMSMFLAGEKLGEKGEEFTQWALEELTAWGKASYRKEDNSFVPILTDGTNLEGYVWKEAPGTGSEGRVIKSLPADLSFFWAYSLAYRTTGDEFMWDMVRDITLGNNLGDIGRTPVHTPELRTDTTCSHVYGLLGFLQLYGKTKNPAYLQMARCIGDNILLNQFHKGFFVQSEKHLYTRFDCFEPLALLHLDLAINSTGMSVPRVWPSTSSFGYPYRHKQEEGLDRLIYALTESTDLPISLQEAATIDDANLVRTLIEDGIEVDSLDNAFLKTALHWAAISGHKDIVELLLVKGADVDAKDLNNETPLYFAVKQGHKDIVELLLVKGADVDAKDLRNETPLHFAVKQGHEEIAELLITNGGDVNAKNNAGQTPLDIAIGKGHKDIAQLLVDKGAKPSTFMASIRLRLLLGQNAESGKSQGVLQKNRLEEEPRTQEQNTKDNTVDDLNSSQSPDMPAEK